MEHSIMIACCTMLAASVVGEYKTTYERNKINFAYETFHSSEDYYELNNNPSQSFTIHTEGCIIPSAHFIDPAFKNSERYPVNNRHCKNSQFPLLGRNDTYIWVIHNNLEWYTIPSNVIFQCCYKGLVISRTSRNLKNRKRTVVYKECIIFNDIIPVNDEYAQVTCGYKNIVLYEQYFAFAIKKRFTLRREYPFENSEETPYNVLILGLASVSRLNFYRTMPATVDFLKDKGAIEFMGYNTASHDPQSTNLVPVLMGLSHSELGTICWPNPLSTFDRCPLIWERFKDAGYFTSFLEDTAKLSILNVNHFTIPGFTNNPTDYYVYPFLQEVESTTTENPYCLGSKFKFQIMLDYLQDLTTTLKTFKLFGMFWESSVTSMDQNNPMLLDYSYKDMLKNLHDSGYLNKTVLIVLSDHGVVYDNMTYNTELRLEEMLPILYILPPPSFSEKYNSAYENLKENSNRLTTPFDLHETLIDLLDVDAINNEELAVRKITPNNRGTSLFLQIPDNRTCESANISNQLCTCFNTKTIIETNIEAQQASKYLMAHLNDLISSYNECAKLTLQKIVQVLELSNLYNNIENNWRDFLVVVHTDPGEHVFEATMRFYINSSIWTRTGEIVNRNKNAKHSYCITEKILKNYCYCI